MPPSVLDQTTTASLLKRYGRQYPTGRAQRIVPNPGEKRRTATAKFAFGAAALPLTVSKEPKSVQSKTPEGKRNGEGTAGRQEVAGVAAAAAGAAAAAAAAEAAEAVAAAMTTEVPAAETVPRFVNLKEKLCSLLHRLANPRAPRHPTPPPKASFMGPPQ